MPRIATLSLMPRAMAGLLSGGWDSTLLTGGRRSNRSRLPEITPEAAAHRVVVAHAEGHAHLGADLDLILVAVGEVRHEAAALGKGDHAVVAGWIRRIDQRIGGERHHVAFEAGPRIGILARVQVA